MAFNTAGAKLVYKIVQQGLLLITGVDGTMQLKYAVGYLPMFYALYF